MSSYYPIQVCRSDGMLEIVTKMGMGEKNQPTAAQMDDTADGEGMVDCYRKLTPEDIKGEDWRRKLGGMMMNLVGGKEHSDRSYILKELPQGYVLWEHVKYKVDKMADNRREKGKHAAGLYERQDAYLYGHPQGRKKRYRSPADFFPHLLWLATDKEGDARNCGCKICSPDEVAQDPKPTAPAKKIVDPKPTIPTPVASKAAVAKPVIAQIMPIPAPARYTEQQMDAEPNGKYVYRPGEVVWFNKGQAWGLSVISKRQILKGKPRYLVQPLSHPLHHPEYQIKDQEDAIRPWLAWSVPAPTHTAIANATFDQVPWNRVISGDYGPGDAQVDGSILAAKAVDSSYSLFDRIENASAVPEEVYYNGMFLGAEKIWVGEAVRIRVPGDDIVVLIVQKLVERTIPPTATSAGLSTVTFVGDVYKFTEGPNPYQNRSQWPTRTDIPHRMIADLLFRNEVADKVKRGVWYDWRLIKRSAKRGLAEVKGRWYETRTLLPILRGVQQFQMDLAQGVTTDAGLWMNGRGDSSHLIGNRKKNRRDTLGGSVPADFKVSRGLDGNPGDDIFPDEQQRQEMPRSQIPTQLSAHPNYSDGDIDQFMNLDQTTGGNDFFGGAMQQ